MFASTEYQLLDFGEGRKLERFGPYVLDRPAPAALGAAPRSPKSWSQADARYELREGERGVWSANREIAAPWAVRHDAVKMELKPTEFGHLGVFPEQAENWDWIASQIRSASRPLKVLNLFAYTGASTLAAAAAGADVVHVDAAANVVAWARRNAEASGLAGARIRWIVEDVAKFVRRELKRGNRYDAVILDPPSYGHGPNGEVWKLADHLHDLLAICLELTAESPQFLLMTCHSGELAFPAGLLQSVAAFEPALRRQGKLECADMCVQSAVGDALHCGAALRWSILGSRQPTHPPTGRPHSQMTPKR